VEKTTTFFKQELDNSIMHHKPSLLEVKKKSLSLLPVEQVEITSVKIK